MDSIQTLLTNESVALEVILAAGKSSIVCLEVPKMLAWTNVPKDKKLQSAQTSGASRASIEGTTCSCVQTIKTCEYNYKTIKTCE